ncbi:MAG TPA: hypothetical protein VEB42_08620 [Chitinophagaceae bacterium]|nr:hypothetical protein [Chitinophagaceae bacterium]
MNEALTVLLATNEVHGHCGFYSNHSDIQVLVQRRLDANILAGSRIRKAISTGKLIACFPFVRFVGISGSLSKGYADEKSDFDFFIITSADRLWICRTLLHLFKKATFLVRRQDQFCMNYFLDISRLQLEEQNIYTAIELASLIPVSGPAVYTSLQTANDAWIKELLPNGYKPFFRNNEATEINPMVKSLAEALLRPLAPWMNSWLMKLTDKIWRRKWRKRNYPVDDYNLAFKTTLYHSKNHPGNHQKKILSQLSA